MSNVLNKISQVYLDQVLNVKKAENEQDLDRWTQTEAKVDKVKSPIYSLPRTKARNERKFGKAGSTEPQGYFGQKPSQAAELSKKRTDDHKAKRGENGAGQNRTGKSGQDLILKVPLGTQVFEEDNKTLIYDFTQISEEYTAAAGGKGGLGNTRFKSSTNRAPR